MSSSRFVPSRRSGWCGCQAAHIVTARIRWFQRRMGADGASPELTSEL
jgi:hypothetical protein